MLLQSLTLIAGAAAILILIASESPSAQESLKVVPVASGFSRPTFMCMAPGDTTRMFVLEKAGTIWLLKHGIKQSTPFMDMRDIVYDQGDERGLCGMVFHPDFQTNGYFYLNFNREGDSAEIVARYHMPNVNANTCSPATQVIMLTIPQPLTIHKAGMMEFGPIDGYLYISSGDGGGAGDPVNAGQDSTTLLGKMIRVDVNQGNQAIAPPSNPFYNRPGWKKEIWAYGLRNPWRTSFDRATGDLWISDVGQYEWEEVNFQSFSSQGGQNYGWRIKEGFHCFKPSTGCDNLGFDFTDPIVEYSHDSGCAVIGGYVYRGCAMPWLRGAYFYADFCGAGVWSLRYGATGVYDQQTWTTQLGMSGRNVTSFAQDHRGELYILTYDGYLYKIVPTSGAMKCSTCCVGKAGNVNGQGTVDLTDLAMLISYFTIPGTILPCEAAANTNGSESVDLTDLSVLVAYLTVGKTLLAPCY